MPDDISEVEAGLYRIMAQVHNAMPPGPYRDHLRAGMDWAVERIVWERAQARADAEDDRRRVQQIRPPRMAPMMTAGAIEADRAQFKRDEREDRAAEARERVRGNK